MHTPGGNPLIPSSSTIGLKSGLPSFRTAQRLKLAYETQIHTRQALEIGFGGKDEGGEVGKAVR